MMVYWFLINLDGDNEVGLLSCVVWMDVKFVGCKVFLLVMLMLLSLFVKRVCWVMFVGYYYELKFEVEEDWYVVGDGIFLNFDFGDVMDFKILVRGC